MASIIDLYILIAGYLGIFPAKSPNINSPKFVFSWCHPRPWICILLCVTHLFIVIEYAFFVMRTNIAGKDEVDRFVFYLFLMVIAISDLIIRVTTLTKCSMIIELTKTLAKSGVQTALRDPSQCTSSEIIYILAALQLLVYSIFRAYYFDLSGGETNSLLFQLFPSSKVTWLRISVQIIFVIFDLLHSCCIHFAFSFLFLAGIELAQNFEKIVNLTLKFSREYSYQIDAIDDLRTEFIALKNCFNIYGEVSGIFFLALFFEVFPDSFRAIIFMIFDSDSSKTSPSHQLTFTVHCIGAFTGMLLLILVINVGHDLMVALGEGKDRVLMMVYDGTNGMFGQEEVNLGKMILHWNWSFSAAGFFPIDRSLFPGIFALLTTYTLIVFQMKLSDQCQVVF